MSSSCASLGSRCEIEESNYYRIDIYGQRLKDNDVSYVMESNVFYWKNSEIVRSVHLNRPSEVTRTIRRHRWGHFTRIPARAASTCYLQLTR